ncbi:MAG: LacI family transcriptional regulator [Anaerolineales bacterium]|nr:LacI family transcriptional regulator [Anaerolineales bacterium]NUQ84437.1 LacI family DNA-binding transcriptional regulator [Anaerolineales bacterium]
MTPTIRDVAKRLKLSITTVSRALDGYDDVAEETRERVIRVAREMGYVPRGAARQLRRRRSEAIGYILPTIQPRFSDPFFSEFIAGLGDEAASNNFDLLVSTAPPGEAAEQLLYERWTHSRRVDGMALSRMRRNDWRVEFLSGKKLPFVTMGRSLNSSSHPYIEVDARSGFAALVGHLVERGHRRIAFIGAPPDLMLQSVRLEGYRDGLAAAGIPFDAKLVVEGNLTRQGGYEAARRLLATPDPPSAIIGINDLTAIGAMRAAHEKGLAIGRDLAVAGYDGIEDAEHSRPPLTTLNQPVYEIARRLVKMLLALIANESLAEPQILLQPELIIRESTSP